ENRILKKQNWRNANDPLEVFNLKVNGKEISFDHQFAADEEWVKSLTFDIKNISGKVLTHVRLGLLLGDPKGKQQVGIAPLFFYGRDTGLPDVKPTVQMKPNDVIHVAYTDKAYEGFK